MLFIWPMGANSIHKKPDEIGPLRFSNDSHLSSPFFFHRATKKNMWEHTYVRECEWVDPFAGYKFAKRFAAMFLHSFSAISRLTWEENEKNNVYYPYTGCIIIIIILFYTYYFTCNKLNPDGTTWSISCVLKHALSRTRDPLKYDGASANRWIRAFSCASAWCRISTMSSVESPETISRGWNCTVNR